MADIKLAIKMPEKKYVQLMLSSIYGVNPIPSCFVGTGNYFKKYKELVLRSLYSNNKRRMKGFPMRRRVSLRKIGKIMKWRNCKW